VTCAIFALFAASLSLLTFCCGVSFFGAGSANCSVVARPPGLVCAHTPVAVKRVASLTCFDMLRVSRGGVAGRVRSGDRLIRQNLGSSTAAAKTEILTSALRIRRCRPHLSIMCLSLDACTRKVSDLKLNMRSKS
jgi:hypothetical protein